MVQLGDAVYLSKVNGIAKAAAQDVRSDGFFYVDNR